MRPPKHSQPLLARLLPPGWGDSITVSPTVATVPGTQQVLDKCALSDWPHMSMSTASHLVEMQVHPCYPHDWARTDLRYTCRGN